MSHVAATASGRHNDETSSESSFRAIARRDGFISRRKLEIIKAFKFYFWEVLR